MTDQTHTHQPLFVVTPPPSALDYAKALADGLLALSQMTPTTHSDRQIETACAGVCEIVSLSRGFRASAALNQPIAN